MNISKEIKIALVAILALIIIYLGIIFLKGLKLFSNEVSYFVEISDVQGMPTESEVRANGLTVGTVKAIVFNSKKQNMVVEITVNPAFNIPQGTSVYMTKEMLGSAKMNLRLGPNPELLLAPGDTIEGDATADLMTAAGNLIPEVAAMLPKMDSILTALNKLANDPSLAASLHNVEDITANLTVTTTRINAMLDKDVPQLMAKANSICTNLDTTTQNLNRINLPLLAQKADATLSNVEQITFKINTAMTSKDNSLGMLMNDNAIALHLDSTIYNAQMLMNDLRMNPKRYVHFSVFGKKDK